MVEVFLWAASCSYLPWSDILTKTSEELSCQHQPPDQTLISQHHHQENRRNEDTSSAALQRKMAFKLQINFGIGNLLGEEKVGSTFSSVW